MKSKVYFTVVKDSDDIQAVKGKLNSLLEESRVVDCISKGDRVAIKAHFGEEGNTGYVRPGFMRVICDAIVAKGGRAFLSDKHPLPGQALDFKRSPGTRPGTWFFKRVDGRRGHYSG